MTLAELVAITGLPGLYRVAGKRGDGLIVTSIAEGKTTFVSGRTHMFTTLDNITMYTTGDGILLKDVFTNMKNLEPGVTTASVKDDASLKEYVAKAIPDYDREKVYVSDMKKLIKWYDLLNGKGLIEELIKEEAAAEATTEEKKEEAPAKKTAKAEDGAKPKKEPKPKAEKNIKASTKPSAAVKKVSAPRKAQ